MGLSIEKIAAIVSTTVLIGGFIFGMGVFSKTAAKEDRVNLLDNRVGKLEQALEDQRDVLNHINLRVESISNILEKGSDK